MTDVAVSTVLTGGSGEDGMPQSETENIEHTNMETVKAEDGPENADPVASSVEKRPAASADEVDADGDSEAETLIQSPEKKRAQAQAIPAPVSTKQASAKDQTEKKDTAPDSEKKSRKRKRGVDDGSYEASSKASSVQSSPLSSPVIAAQSRDSDSDASNRSAPRSARAQRSKRHAIAKADPDSAEANGPPKPRRRRPSDIIPPTSKQRPRGSVDGGLPERRETRSATYPRPSSEERSPSPRPSSRRDHRRGISTQLTSTDVERKRRGRPPTINTGRRNKSADRAELTSDDSSSPSRTRPSLPKFSSHDQDSAMSPAKATGPRKYRDKNGRTFLSRACNNDDLERAKVCHQERPEDLNVPDNAGNSPLQIAALEGFVDVVRFLLEKGAEVDTRNIDKETPLIDAVENGHWEVVKLLLEFGANPRLGNAKGDEPYELVPLDDENYKSIRKLIADAKDHDFSKRRRSHDNKDGDRERGSSRAASSASLRDSPPILAPRSPPPAIASRRRTGRSESTRNDLLWQPNTPENLKIQAAKGNVQGVIYVLNILQKAEPEAVIAAAKAGHEEVLQYLLAMGDADPDPDPVPDLKAGFNTPILAAIGRGHLDVVKLLVEQTGFNPTRKWKGKTYHEIAADRKGDKWQQEHDILRSAYEKHASGKPRKTSSPCKTRELDRSKEKKARRSMSPLPIIPRHSSSPSLTHKSLPEKSPKSLLNERKRDTLSPHLQDRRKASAAARDASDSVAVSSDQEQTVTDKKAQKHRRSQSDLPPPASLEADIAQRKRRLVTGKEHRRRRSAVTGADPGEGSETEGDVKREGETATAGVKRTRTSMSSDPRPSRDSDADRITLKKRRTVLESSPEESRPPPTQVPTTELTEFTEMKGATSNAKVLSQIEEIFKQHGKRSSQDLPSRSKSTTPVTEDKPPTVRLSEKESLLPNSPSAKSKSKSSTPAPAPVKDDPAHEEKAEAERQKREEEEKAADEARRVEEERLAVETLAAEKAAAEKAAAEREAAEKAAAERRIAEEAAAKRRAEEEAMARKKEEEERQERIRRELEDTKRRQEEQIRQQHLEIERRRREALPSGLAKCSLLLETGDPAYALWISRFLPLFTARTEQLDPACSPLVAQDLWVPNWQVAVLLGTKDLNLRNYTSFDKREATLNHRDRMWRVGRQKLSYDYETTMWNTPVKTAVEIERRERPKFFALSELFWVRVRTIASFLTHPLMGLQLSDVHDQVIRHPHLSGMKLTQQSISLRPQHEIIAEGQARERALLSKQQPNGIPLPTPRMVNGIHASPTFGVFGNGGPRY